MALAAGLWLIWSPLIFSTLDGPCHVYLGSVFNAVAAGDSFYSKYIHLHGWNGPNGFGNYLLNSLLLCFSSHVAEKIFFSTYLLLFCFSFRMLFRLLLGEYFFGSVALVFFAFNAQMASGYINYLFGLAWFGVVCSLFLLWVKKPQTTYAIALGVAFLILYKSHLIPFLLCVVFAGAYLLFEAFFQKNWKVFWGKTIKLIAISLIPLLLCSYYFITQDSTKDYHYLPVDEWCWKFFHFFTFTWTKERADTALFVWIWISVFLSSISFVLFVFYQKLKRMPTAKHFTHGHVFGLFYTMLLGIAALLIPDSSGEGGDMTLRLLFFVSFFGVLIWINLARWEGFRVAILGLLTFMFCLHFNKVYSIQKVNSEKASRIENCAEMLQKFQLLEATNFSWFWPTIHYSDYIAAKKHMLLPGMLGGTNSYFVLNWREDIRVQDQVRCMEFLPAFCDKNWEQETFGMEVKYKLAITELPTESNYRNTIADWKQHAYHEVYTDTLLLPHVRLFELRPSNINSP